MKEDKIFNNSFNRGDIEFEVFGQSKPIAEIGSDLYDEFIELKIQEELNNIYQNSPYSGDFDKNRKTNKAVIAEIYYYFEERLIGKNEMSAVEKFTSIAEFMSAPYDILYQELSPSYKEKLLRELDGKYKIFAKKKIKRLF